MAQKPHKDRSNPASKFVMLEDTVVHSAAWQHASGNACKLYVALLDLYNGRNNGHLYFSVRSAAAVLRCHRDTASKALRELETLGFIRPAKKGSFDLMNKVATTWRMTSRATATAPATEEYLRWRPDKEGTVPEFGTDGPKNPDRRSFEPVEEVADGPKNPDRNRRHSPRNGPKKQDTSTSFASDKGRAPPPEGGGRKPQSVADMAMDILAKGRAHGRD